MTAARLGNRPSAGAAARSVNADWVRAMQRTAAVTPAATRTLASVLDENAATRGERPALVGETARLTHAELSALSNRYSRWALEMGLRPGDRVALIMANQPDYPAIWIGLSRVGVLTALVNTQLVGTGLAHCIALAAPRYVIVDGDRLPILAAMADSLRPAEIWVHGVDGAPYPRIDNAVAQLSSAPLDAGPVVTLRDPALLIYTSGTTGLPKAAHVSHFRIMMWSEWFAGIMDATPRDRLYDCLPMYHSVGGVVAVGAMLAAGGAVIVRTGFSASRFWQDVAASEATIFQYIGELCRYLLNAPESAAERGHRLRLCCGNGLRADVWAGFEARFAIPRIIEFYAATEGSFSLFNLEGRPGAIGRIPRFIAHRSPVALVAFDVAEERPVRDADGFCRRCAPHEAGEAIGLVAAQAANLATRFEGYTSAAESERKLLRDVFAKGDVWFRTGDLMKQDDKGFFYFVDRIGDTFRWKGENVATSEVADVICACAGVLEASVYGVAVPFAEGRAGMAALVVLPDFDLSRLRHHLVDHLPRFARPVFLRIRDRLATTSTFKVPKSDDVRQGFDPELVSDALFVDDVEMGAYRPVDAALHAAILSGAFRL